LLVNKGSKGDFLFQFELAIMLFAVLMDFKKPILSRKMSIMGIFFLG